MENHEKTSKCKKGSLSLNTELFKCHQRKTPYKELNMKRFWSILFVHVTVNVNKAFMLDSKDRSLRNNVYILTIVWAPEWFITKVLRLIKVKIYKQTGSILECTKYHLYFRCRVQFLPIYWTQIVDITWTKLDAFIWHSISGFLITFRRRYE